MVVGQVIGRVTQTGDAAQLVAEIERSLAKQRSALAANAVISHAGINRRRTSRAWDEPGRQCRRRAARAACHVALVTLVVLRIHVKNTSDIIKELALRRGNPKLLGRLVEVQIADVGSLRKLPIDCRQAILILKLVVFPFAVGGNRGPGVRTGCPVDLRGQTGIGIDDPRFDFARDIAVVRRSHYRQQRRCKQRIGCDNAERIRSQRGTDNHTLRTVVPGLHVIGNEGEFEILVWCHFDATATTVAFVAVYLGAQR